MLRAAVILLFALLGVSLAYGQQTAFVPVEIHRVGDALVIIVTPSQPISLAGLRFQITRSDTPQTPVFLREFFAETAIDFYTFDQPACLALEPLDSRALFPIACQQMSESRILRQPVVPADIFWIDFVTLSARPVSILDDSGTTITLCPSSPEPCAIQYPFAPPTTAPAPEPVLAGEPADIANREVLVLISEFEVFSEAAGERVNPQLSWERQFQEAIDTVDEIQNARVLSIPGVIRSHHEARALSEQYQATMVVWGYVDAAAVASNYTITPRWSDVNAELSETGSEVFPATLDEMALYVSRDSDVDYIFNFLIAQLFYFEDNFEVAVSFLDNALAEIPIDHVDQMGASALYFQRGYIAQLWENNYESAVQFYTNGLELNPEDSVAYNNRGNAYRNMREYEQALADFDRALELDPAYVLAYTSRGIAYTELGEYERALADFDRALELDPAYVLAYTSRGIVYARLGEYERALADFDRTLGLAPEHVDAYMNRGNVYIELGEYERALVNFDRALELDPAYVLAYYNRGLAHSRFGNYEQAIVNFDRALELDPAYVLAYTSRGIAYTDLGEHEQALADFDRALELDPEAVAAYYNRGKVYARLGDHERALADFDRALELDPEEAATYFHRGNVYFNLGDYEQAVEDFSRAIQINPQFADAYGIRGLSYEVIGELEFALADYRQYAELTGDNALEYILNRIIELEDMLKP